MPEIFEPLREWVNGPVQLHYVIFANASMAFYGWAFLRTKVLPRWIGWVTLAWSLALLILALVTQDTLPAMSRVSMVSENVRLSGQRKCHLYCSR